MSLINRLLARSDRRAERRSIAGRHHLDDASTLGGKAASMTVDYRVAVARDEPRENLAWILTGIAGCDLAASACYHAAGWDPQPPPDGPSHAEATRLGGLIVQEVAYCAAEGMEYRGVRAIEYQRVPIGEALRNVAIAYVGLPGEWVVSVRLRELMDAARVVAGGQALETLATLAAAHREAEERTR